MLSIRGWIVLGSGIGLWIAARMIGSPSLHIVAVGLVLTPVIAWGFVVVTRHRMNVTRRLSATKAPLGQRLTVDLEIENRSPSTTSFVLVEDRVPAALGRSARMVLTGLPGHNSQHVRYPVTARARGRYAIGPLSLSLSDPFALTRIRLTFDHVDHVVIFPEVEDLDTGVASPFGAGRGRSLSRQLLPSGEEFYTMREYQIGDDLRRIHWPSVARRNRLMIRQDEASRRGTSALFIDTRAGALGLTGEPGFERAVSVAASLGVLMARSGFSVRLATSASRPRSVSQDQLLENLSSLGHVHASSLAESLVALRAVAGGDSTLVVVTAPPGPREIASLTRTGAAFGPKLAVLVYPVEPRALPAQGQSELEGRASVARLSLMRAGWNVVVLSPSQRLKDTWRASRATSLSPTGSSR
ncbi:MAG: DUF58 domain-containing protein [Actinomycetota bacterium]